MHIFVLIPVIFSYLLSVLLNLFSYTGHIRIWHEAMWNNSNNDIMCMCMTLWLYRDWLQNTGLSRSTGLSRYLKKHSPTHTYHGYQSSLFCYLHLLRSMASSVFNLRAWQSFPQSPNFLWSTSWPSTLRFILHTFLHPIIVFFSQHIPIPSQPVLL